MSEPCLNCSCRWESSPCVHVSTSRGIGDDPYVFTPTYKDDPDNLLECGPAGSAAFMPPYLEDPPCVEVYSNVEQTIPYFAAQPIFFNQERYDTDSMHDDAENQSRITIKTSGVYLVSLNFRWDHMADTPDTGDVAAYIRMGPEFWVVDSFPIGHPDTFIGHSIAVQGKFQSGDYVEAWALQTFKVGDEKKAMRITVHRMSPNFAASFLRPLP